MKPLSHYFDHTLLKANASQNDIERHVNEALKFQFASVCVNPIWISLVSNMLKGSSVAPCTVVGFPLGANLPSVKVKEAVRAIEDGAKELDLVMAISYFKSGQYRYVVDEIAAVVLAAGKEAIVKVIIETCYLSTDEIVEACKLVKDGGAHFVKTSTGFGTRGATVKDVELIRKTVGPDFGVKASGGIRDYDTTFLMINAGADRIGSSSSVSICQLQ